MEYIPAKHLVIRNKSTAWFGTDHTMNIYRGCCHGCIYCDSRSDCYHIDRFDTVRAKADALTILRDDLRRKVRPGIVGMGSMSDPYNPITRDIDVLGLMQEHVPVICKMTVTTTDEDLAARIEPHAPSPARRLEAVRALSEAGIFAGILLMPVLPFLEDSEENVLAVVEAAARAGAKFVYPAFGMTMRDGQRAHYLERLEAAFPGRDLAGRYLRQYGERYECPSPRAKRLWGVFSRRCDELGLLYRMEHIVGAYQRGYGDRQLSFFDL